MPACEAHLAISGDAALVLPALAPDHAGTVDAVVIDPPYDEGRPAHWKMSPFTYNDSRGDTWRGWLSGILECAKPLMRPGAPVAVSIGHKRVHELAFLLTEVFPGREVVTITVDSGPRAAARGVSHRAEYVLIAIEPGTLLGAPGFTSGETRTGWQGCVLSSADAVLYPNQAYPIWVGDDGRIVGIGRSVAQLVADGELSDASAFYYSDVEAPPAGTHSLWPITRNGRRGTWRLSQSAACEALEGGWIRADLPHMPGQAQTHVVKFLGTGTRKRIASGEIAVHGRDERGALIIDRAGPAGAAVPTIWTGSRYLSRAGSDRLAELAGPGRFAYPKPVGLIADIITAVTRGAPDAKILDFFAGTGTVFDAATELNAADGGRRRTVMVTLDENGIFDVLRTRCDAVAAERGEQIEYVVSPRSASTAEVPADS